jgi:hypothetical protein
MNNETEVNETKDAEEQSGLNDELGITSCKTCKDKTCQSKYFYERFMAIPFCGAHTDYEPRA